MWIPQNGHAWVFIISYFRACKFVGQIRWRSWYGGRVDTPYHKRGFGASKQLPFRIQSAVVYPWRLRGTECLYQSVRVLKCNWLTSFEHCLQGSRVSWTAAASQFLLLWPLFFLPQKLTFTRSNTRDTLSACCRKLRVDVLCWSVALRKERFVLQQWSRTNKRHTCSTFTLWNYYLKRGTTPLFELRFSRSRQEKSRCQT